MHRQLVLGSLYPNQDSQIHRGPGPLFKTVYYLHVADTPPVAYFKSSPGSSSHLTRCECYADGLCVHCSGNGDKRNSLYSFSTDVNKKYFPSTNAELMEAEGWLHVCLNTQSMLTFRRVLNI